MHQHLAFEITRALDDCSEYIYLPMKAIDSVMPPHLGHTSGMEIFLVFMKPLFYDEDRHCQEIISSYPHFVLEKLVEIFSTKRDLNLKYAESPI